MKAKQIIHQAKAAKWASLIKEQTESGLTIKQWCARSGHSFHAYNYWKHVFKETALENVDLPDIVPLNSPPVATLEEHSLKSPDSYKSREQINPSSSILVSLGDIRIEIGAPASDDMISSIIKAVNLA